MSFAAEDLAQGKLGTLLKREIERAVRARMLIPARLSSLVNSQLEGYFSKEKAFEFRAEGIVLNSTKRSDKTPIRRRLRKH